MQRKKKNKISYRQIDRHFYTFSKILLNEKKNTIKYKYKKKRKK